MSEKGAIKKSTAQAICDAVKVKEGTTEGVPFKDVAERIMALPTASGENKLTQILDRSVTEITAEDLQGVENIGAYAFSGCSGLKTVHLPNGLKTIGDRAFADCPNLIEVNIPSSITIIGEFSFSTSGTTLSKVYIEDLKSFMQITFTSPSSNFSNPIQRAGKFYLKNEQGVYEIATVINVPSGIDTISSCLFRNAGNIEEVNIGDEVLTIRDSAFDDCEKLKKVNLGNTITSIGYGAFNYTALTSVVIPNSVTTIGGSAFMNTKLTTVRIGNGITSIGTNCFHRTRLIDIYIDAPEGSISGSPWGASSATIHWNTPLPSEEV